jgi:hypothetical protein
MAMLRHLLRAFHPLCAYLICLLTYALGVENPHRGVHVALQARHSVDTEAATFSVHSVLSPLLYMHDHRYRVHAIRCIAGMHTT